MPTPSRRGFRRALVTGGAGFLGTHLCERLLDDGSEVVCIDSFVTSEPGNVAHLSDDRRFRLVRADVTAQPPLPLPRGDAFDLVCHFASPASPLDYHEFPVLTLKAGSHGTLNALDIARQCGARFVLASTSEVYGDPLEHPQRESYRGNVNPVGPRSVYDEAKRFAEAVTTAYRRSHGLDTAIVRIFNTYGPRMRPFDGRAVPTFIRQALSGQPLTVAGDGSQTRSVCYVDDTVDGILALARSDHAGPVNIGNPQELTVLELARLVRDLVGSQSAVEFVPRPEDDPEIRRPDITLARELLDWKPQVSPVTGLGATIAWFADRRAAESPAGYLPLPGNVR